MNLRVSGFILLIILAAERHPIEAQTSGSPPDGMPPSGSPPDRTLSPALSPTPNPGQSNADRRPKESYNPLQNCVPPEDPTSYQNRLQEYQTSLESDPNNPYFLQQLGILHSRLLQWDEAQNYFFKALTYNKTKRRPDKNQNSEIYRQLGDLYACQQQFNKAIDQYKQSIRSNPQDLADRHSAERRSDVKHNLALTQLLAEQQHQKGENQQTENDQTNAERRPNDSAQQNSSQTERRSAENNQEEQKPADQTAQSNSDKSEDQLKESKSSQSSAADGQKENSEAERRPNEKSQTAFLSRQQAEQLLNSVSENRKKYIQRLLKRQPPPPSTDKYW